MYLRSSNTESCDEDDDEVGVGDEEELVDKPGTTNGTQFDILQSILLHFLVKVVFDRWSSGYPRSSQSFLREL